VALDDVLIEVVGLAGIQRPQREVIDDQDVDAGEPTDLGLEGVVQAGRRAAG
jgi:hypothetical protein